MTELNSFRLFVHEEWSNVAEAAKEFVSWSTRWRCWWIYKKRNGGFKVWKLEIAFPLVLHKRPFGVLLVYSLSKLNARLSNMHVGLNGGVTFRLTRSVQFIGRKNSWPCNFWKPSGPYPIENTIITLSHLPKTAKSYKIVLSLVFVCQKTCVVVRKVAGFAKAELFNQFQHFKAFLF